ncbi:5'/3'-nucleotidase SurE [Pontibacterium granulatum]|uniref:5'/3'-nucleotidase SurE n=1 Tax=Pontibacterium granulatum TaxID=2036029 RepID=UPI00249A15A9|nr:5'/3'-nucleotidase SurE [Pontibacterium granulatum]MDI3322945.1 5'/3'-nucleotidase SurE [Pontibacterium granulatum]
MKVLISNDDGVFAPGLATLAKVLRQDCEIEVVAPDRNRSGASNSLTLDRPLEAFRHENGFVGVNGTPTDCVHLGTSGVFDFEPDIVVSGINAGANMGDDVLYSGTVAAATEGRHRKFPPIAVSVANHHPQYFETAAEIVCLMVAGIAKVNLAPRTVLNVNVPDLPMDQIQGVHVTRLGHRSLADKPVKVKDPRGCERYWIAGVGEVLDREPGTDFFAIEQGYVSITPLQIDMTQYEAMDNLGSWLEGIL